MRQAELFLGAAELPSGLVYQPQFLDASGEASLIEAIGALTLREAKYKEYTARRRVASFGAGYDFDANELTPAPEIAPFLLPLRSRVAEWIGVPADAFGYAMVAEYAPGTQLGWHRDVPQFEMVVGLSLAASATMRLRGIWPGAICARLRIERRRRRSPASLQERLVMWMQSSPMPPGAARGCASMGCCSPASRRKTPRGRLRAACAT